MTSAPSRGGTSLSTLLLLALLLLLAGGAAAIWGLSHFPAAARLAGLSVADPAPAIPARPLVTVPGMAMAIAPTPATLARVETLEDRLSRVEAATARAEGSAGRADALLVAFAARRAIDRGVALGYLEPLLNERFAATHPQAVATIVTAARRPVRLDQLNAEFADLEPRLKAPPASDSLWQTLRHEMGGLISIRRADQPSPRPSPTYQRAAARLSSGQVDQALAEAMRLPGIGGAPKWVADARTFIAAHRALDEVEGAALLAR